MMTGDIQEMLCADVIVSRGADNSLSHSILPEALQVFQHGLILVYGQRKPVERDQERSPAC